ncbi:hypothetical protein [Hyphomicrobium zavarzinii]|uniref:hypothetical protein n=1 Tax=Hyphomicrobium zavarzinii TaxID=48292 RepID=UPI0012EBBBC4|nr:hypothetical protein [Hyphomicrobium zavarzinii]
MLVRNERRDHYHQIYPYEWIKTIRRIFAEENLHYSVDDEGGVHFAFDKEFMRGQTATVSMLGRTRYSNVRKEFEGVDAALSEIPPNGKAAIRSVFTAAEGLFRLMYPSAPRLGAAEIAKHLLITLQTVYSNDNTALRAASKTLTSFQAWTDAAHFYRHEVGKQDVAQPPLGLTLNIVSQGATFIRWLAEIDDAQSGT